ncbi:hypothetical protein [Burkholderia lata]|uniref:hypothetical protein n=1 Tax=Burkholderia lata (strain ATCC 17760 / DSM 23089 / LMG 22485 / NCIMB 9086 / R18194 / 383) TaxID=482957 RepID=UPI00158378D1|nr:hypothetical protein [Burkholderia lata]
MAVSDEIALSMTAIMTAFASGENRSMLNQPFRNGKTCIASLHVHGASAFPSGKARSRNDQTTLRAPPAESNPFRARRAPASETRHVFCFLSREDRVSRSRDAVAANRA